MSLHLTVFRSKPSIFQDQDISDSFEITANGSLRRKLYFDEHSDIEHYDSEQTDDEIPEPRPPSSFEAHMPIVFSPDLVRAIPQLE